MQSINSIICVAYSLENVSNVVVYRNFSSQLLVDKFGDISSTLITAECRANPLPASDKLEGPSLDFMT